MVRRYTQGLTLVELMVAMVLGLIIMGAIALVFLSSRSAYVAQDNLARVQENGRFAMHYLMRDIRMAGFMGCLPSIASRLHNQLNVSATAFPFGSAPIVNDTDPLARRLEGINDAVNTSLWPSGASTKPANALYSAQPPDLPANHTTDMIAIRLADPANAAAVTVAMRDEADPLTVSTVAPFRTNDIVVVANCEAADLFQISSIDASNRRLLHGVAGDAGFQPGNRTNLLSTLYGLRDSAQVFRLLTRIYYIARNPNGIPSLYVQDNGGAPLELVEGIESLQVLYGVTSPASGTSKQPLRYLPAGHPDLTWANVVSVRIGVLARTSANNPDHRDTESHNVLGVNIGPYNDNQRRRVFEATISLKSAVL